MVSDVYLSAVLLRRFDVLARDLLNGMSRHSRPIYELGLAFDANIKERSPSSSSNRSGERAITVLVSS